MNNYEKSLKNLLSAANKVRYLWETPEVLENDELILTRIVSFNESTKRYLGIKLDSEGYVTFFHRNEKGETTLQTPEEMTKTLNTNYPYIKSKALKQDFLRVIQQPLERYEDLSAEVKVKAKQKLSFLEAILSH